MAVPGPLSRVSVAAGGLLAVVLAVVGGLALAGPGMVAVGVAGLLAGMTAAAVARDAPGHTLRSTIEVAALAAAGTLGALLVIAGTATLVGGAITAVVVGLVLVGWLVHHLRRSAAAPTTGTRPWRQPAADVVTLAAFAAPTDGEPVAGLSTAALGREWLRTTALLSGRLDATARRVIVERREQTLDELERRDPAGFHRWMSGGPEPGSDPAEYVRGGPVTGTEAA